jgi:hypothetical protein
MLVAQYRQARAAFELEAAQSALSAEQERLGAERDREVAANLKDKDLDIAGLNKETERIKSDASKEKQESDERIAALTRQTSVLSATAKDAEARIAEAQRATEEEKTERMRLETQVAPRSLSLDQQRTIGRALARFAGRTVSVATYSLDAEGAILGQQIMASLQASGINVQNATASILPLGGFSLGVSVSGPDIDLVFSIYGILSSIGHLAVSPPNSPSGGGTRMQAGTSPGTAVPSASILVGIKPIPVLGKQ